MKCIPIPPSNTHPDAPWDWYLPTFHLNSWVKVGKYSSPMEHVGECFGCIFKKINKKMNQYTSGPNEIHGPCTTMDSFIRTHPFRCGPSADLEMLGVKGLGFELFPSETSTHTWLPWIYMDLWWDVRHGLQLLFRRFPYVFCWVTTAGLLTLIFVGRDLLIHGTMVLFSWIPMNGWIFFKGNY